MIVEWLQRWTCDQQVAGLTPGCTTFMWRPSASCSHSCASVTKQYNLVLAKWQWCSMAGKITAGLASLWRCVRLSGIPTSPPTGSMAYDRVMNTANIPVSWIHRKRNTWLHDYRYNMMATLLACSSINNDWCWWNKSHRCACSTATDNKLSILVIVRWCQYLIVTSSISTWA